MGLLTALAEPKSALPLLLMDTAVLPFPTSSLVDDTATAPAEAEAAAAAAAAAAGGRLVERRRAHSGTLKSLVELIFWMAELVGEMLDRDSTPLEAAEGLVLSEAELLLLKVGEVDKTSDDGSVGVAEAGEPPPITTQLDEMDDSELWAGDESDNDVGAAVRNSTVIRNTGGSVAEAMRSASRSSLSELTVTWSPSSSEYCTAQGVAQKPQGDAPHEYRIERDEQ